MSQLEERSRVLQASVLSILLMLSMTAVFVAVPSGASAYTWHVPVTITGNADFTPENGVTEGSGTLEDPFIIEGWEFTDAYYGGIQVVNTTAHFVIRDIYTHYNGVGVILRNVTNGIISSSDVEFNFFGWGCYGIVLDHCTRVNVSDNNITIHDRGIYVVSSTQCDITGNNLSANNLGIALEGVTDSTIQHNNISTAYVSAVQLDYCLNMTVSSNWIHDADSGSGVNLRCANETIVTENTLEALSSGFIVTTCSNDTLSDNVLIGTAMPALTITESNAVTFQGNDISEIFRGIQIDYSENINLIDNTVSPVPDMEWSSGLDLCYSTMVRVIGNTFLTAQGIFIWGSELEHFNTHMIPLGNTLNGSDIVYVKNTTGVVLDAVEAGQLIVVNCSGVDVTAIGPECWSMELYFVTDAYVGSNEFLSARVMYSENVVFYDNLIMTEELDYGIGCWNSEGIYIFANCIVAPWAAIALNGCDGCIIDTNLLGSIDDGIVLHSCSEVDVIYNLVLLAHIGILLSNTYMTTVEMNAVGFCDYGIVVEGSDDVVVCSNDIEWNGYGVTLWSAANTWVYHNNICNNTVQAYDYNGLDNSWDSGYPGGGNYWYDYDGVDLYNGEDQNVAGPDGIGDTPYVFSGNEDSYPLMNPFGVNAVPAADAGDDQRVNVGDEVAFDGTRSWDDVGITNYTWTFEYDDEEVELYEASPTYQFLTGGEYTVALTVTDEEGKVDTDTVIITVNEPPVAEAGEDQTDVVEGDTMTFDGSVSSDDFDVTNYSWTFTYDGTDKELWGASPTFDFDIAGVYIVTLTVSDEDGLTDTDTVTITVSEPLPPENIAPVANAGLNQTVDVGTTVTFDGTGSADSDGTIASYEWIFTYNGTTRTLTGPAPVFEFEIPGSYTVTLTVTDDDGATGTDTVTVTVEETEDEPLEDDETFLGTYGLPIAALVVLLVVVTVAAMLLMKKRKSGQQGT